MSTLRELIADVGELATQENKSVQAIMDMPVLLSTSDRHNLSILSIYLNEGKLAIDIGEAHE